MKWLLLFMIFDISNNGMKLKMQATKAFATEEACEAEGRNLSETAEYDDANLRSMSICIPQDAFNE